MSENTDHTAGQQPNVDGAQRPQHPLANYQFSADELRVLRECDVESFFQRSLPLGTTFGLAAYAAVKRGMLTGSARFGAGPKVAIGVIFGYFLGKFSYQSQCAEKLMRLPDSRLAEMLRMRKRGGIADSFSVDQGYGSALSMSPFASATDQYSDVAAGGKSSSLNLDTERPSNSGLDDAFRPNVDVQVYEDNLPLNPPKGQTTYDELRKRNREEHQAKRSSNPLYRPLEEERQPPPVIRASPPPSSGPADDGVGRRAKNKYGDDWSS